MMNLNACNKKMSIYYVKYEGCIFTMATKAIETAFTKQTK